MYFTLSSQKPDTTKYKANWTNDTSEKLLKLMDKVYILTALEASKNLSQMELNKIFLIITEQMLSVCLAFHLERNFYCTN